MWRAEWVVFLDDGVCPAGDWLEQLDIDRAGINLPVAASQGQLRVPLPNGRPPTDWERNVAGLEGARWITADMAYRRSVLEELGGFDERFKRAFREDAELALRVTQGGYRIVDGSRCVEHPVRPASPWISVRAQAGNADDALMKRLHGDDWHRRAASSVGRRSLHLLTTVSLLAGAAGMLSRRRWLAIAGFGSWAATTTEFAWARIAPGPRTAQEIGTMVVTSLAIPPVASAHWLQGLWRWRRAMPIRPGRPAASLFDRDGTLVQDVPYNGDPEQVVAMPRARLALDQLRAAGIRVGVVSNQSGVGRGLCHPAPGEGVHPRR